MKKIMCVILSAALLSGIAGCTDKTNDTADTDAVTTAVTEPAIADTEESTPATEESTSVTDEPAESFGVSTYTETFLSGECSVTLVYPRYGDGEHELFDISMRNFAMTKYNQSGTMTDVSAVYEIKDCDIKYESEYFVSAVMTGHIIDPTAAHDTHFAYTVNADPRTGRVYLSEELIGDVETMKSAMHEGKFEKSYGIDGLEDALRDNVVTYGDITQSWRSDYGVFPDMYFTEESLGVIAEIPHVVGGYAGFEIPYADAGDMINPVAKGLCGLIVTTD